MKLKIAPLAALLAAGSLTGTLQAQDVKVNVLGIVWYNQTMDRNLRTNSLNPHYTLAGSGSPSAMAENGFSLRRSEIYLAGKVNDTITANVIFDPKEETKPLLDAYFTWKPATWFELKAGQFKPLQTYEATSVSAADLLFTDRAQFARRVGDIRDRGVVAGFTFGDKTTNFKVSTGVFNGANRANDANAQKDFVARFDVTLGDQKFGVYGLKGQTDKKDVSPAYTQTSTFTQGTGLPSTREVFDHKDATSINGAYYYANFGGLHIDAEVAMGQMGRYLFPTFLTPNPLNPTPEEKKILDAAFSQTAMARQHLDQKFATAWVTAAYTFDNHTLKARVDVLNLNAGEEWYTATDPYKTTTADYTPNYSEITLGYTYAFDPKLVRKANFKLDYILRSKNTHLPNAQRGQTKEQGGDSIVAAFQFFL